MKAGSIAVVGGGTDFLSKSIELFSSTRLQKCNKTHTEIGAGNRINDVNNTVQPLVFGARLLVDLTPHKPQDYPIYRIYDWVPEMQAMAALVSDELINELDDKFYGINQYPFFMWRKLLNILRLPSQWAIHQWFKGDYICTTVAYEQIKRTLAPFHIEFSYPYGDALTPLDIQNICEILVKKNVLVLSESKEN